MDELKSWSLLIPAELLGTAADGTRRQRRILNNAWVGAFTDNPGIGSYIASKHGVAGLTVV